MTRTVMLVLGAVLALFVVFTFIIPALFALLKFALIIGVIALVVFMVVAFLGKTSAR